MRHIFIVINYIWLLELSDITKVVKLYKLFDEVNVKRLFSMAIFLIVFSPMNSVADDKCDKFEWIIDNSLKEISLLNVQGMFEDSAARAVNGN
jgi:hypothetical protein